MSLTTSLPPIQSCFATEFATGIRDGIHPLSCHLSLVSLLSSPCADPFFLLPLLRSLEGSTKMFSPHLIFKLHWVGNFVSSSEKTPPLIRLKSPLHRVSLHYLPWHPHQKKSTNSWETRTARTVIPHLKNKLVGDPINIADASQPLIKPPLHVCAQPSKLRQRLPG